MAKAKSGINDLASVVDGLREKGLLGAIPSRGIEHKVTCSRELLGDELYEKLRRVCYRIEFLGRFDLEQLENILKCATVHEYKEHDPIFLQHAEAETMCVVLEGSVALFRKQMQVERHGSVHNTRDQSFQGVQQTKYTMDEYLSGTMSMVDWSCELDMNRWKRYLCSLRDGHLRWYENKDAESHLGEIKLAEATTCAFINKNTVGYKRAARMLSEKELADLDKGQIFAILSHGRLHLFDTGSRKTTEIWVEKIRQHVANKAPDVSHELKDGYERHQAKIDVHKWLAKTRQSGKSAWSDVFQIFGEPVRVVCAGGSFGEVTAVLDNYRGYTALAMESCVLIQVHNKLLHDMDLWDVVVPGSMWMPLHDMLRPEPMERKNAEIDYILTAVNYMPFFHQLPQSVRRGFLELCKTHVSSEDGAVLGQYKRPFTSDSSIPVYLVLQGKIEIYQGHLLLKEGVQALSNASFQDLQALFPRKVQDVYAEEAWGGPQLIQERGNEAFRRLDDELKNEVDPKKAKELRALLQVQSEASTYTVIATEGTSYLTIEQIEWYRMFLEVRDAVFRMSTLIRLLQKPTRDRSPHEARLMACLLQGYLFFQQLPFRNTLDLAYTCKVMVVEAGIVLAKEGLPCSHVLFLLAGTASVHKSRGQNNLRLPIGLGKTVTLEDAQVFFGPVSSMMHEGGSFGTDSVRNPLLTSAHSLVASSRCHILQIPAEEYSSKVGKFTKPFAPLSDGVLTSIRKPAKARLPSEARDLVASLGNVGLLGECTQDFLKEIAEYITVKSAERGSILAAEGVTQHPLMIVLSGSASIHMQKHDYGMLSEESVGEINWPTPTDLSMTRGMCHSIVEVGGSFGELVLATSLPRESTVIARETCLLLTLDTGKMPLLVLQDLKDFVMSCQGIPRGLSKAPELRSEYDLVKAVDFLSKLEYFKDYSVEVMVNVSKIAEFLSFDEGATIQTNNLRETYLYIVYGGKVQLVPERDASIVLFAASGLKAKNKKDRANINMGPVPSSVASPCLQHLASDAFKDSAEKVNEAVEKAMQKWAEIISPEKKFLSGSKSKKKNKEPLFVHASTEPEAIKQMEEKVLDAGKHFVLGDARAVERCQLVRVNWTKWQLILQNGLKNQLQNTILFLQRMKAFSRWRPKILHALAERTKIVKFPKNSVVVAKGQALTSVLYIVKSGSCSLHGTVMFQGGHGVEMKGDDKLYQVAQQQHVASGNENYAMGVNSRKLFRCPQCPTASLTGSSPQRSRGPQPCAMCQGTGAVIPDALSKTSQISLVHSEQRIEVCLGAIALGSIVNAALDKTGKPLDHSIIADDGCELYRINIKDLLDLCDGNDDMLNDLQSECQLNGERDSRRIDIAQGAHSKLHEQGDLLLHPRNKEDFGGEKPNQFLLDQYQRIPKKTFGKPVGCLSMSKCGQQASRRLRIPMSSNSSGTNNHSPHMSMSEKRVSALGLHKMEQIKAKHAGAAALAGRGGAERQTSVNEVTARGGAERQRVADTSQYYAQVLQVSRGSHSGAACFDVDDKEKDFPDFIPRSDDGEDASHLRTERKSIGFTAPGGEYLSGGEEEAIDARNLPEETEAEAETVAKDAPVGPVRRQSISFWDETGKHEDMPTHLDMDILETPSFLGHLSKSLDDDEEEQENRRAQEVYQEGLGNLMNLHRDLLRTLPRVCRSKSQVGTRSKPSPGQKRGTSKDAVQSGRSRSTLPCLHNFDSMQHIYADVKDLNRKIQYVDDPSVFQRGSRHQTGEVSGWETTGDQGIAESLPSVTGKSTSQRRRAAKKSASLKKMSGLEMRSDEKSMGTEAKAPMMSHQVFAFGDSSTSVVVKAKIPRGKERTKERRYSPPLKPEERRHSSPLKPASPQSSSKPASPSQRVSPLEEHLDPDLTITLHNGDYEPGTGIQGWTTVL